MRRAPCGARLVALHKGGGKPGISIHAPLAGCDVAMVIRPPSYRHFNPRAPCGARPGTVRAGRSTDGFQSTRPVRGATAAGWRAPVMSDLFQSTRPVRGATQCGASQGPWCRISIHAPRAGRDKVLHKLIVLLTLFQSTRPVRGATGYTPDDRETYVISIHAPRAGRDVGSGATASASLDFNPRAPCGARLVRYYGPDYDNLFQSTRPVRGATSSYLCRKNWY